VGRSESACLKYPQYGKPPAPLDDKDTQSTILFLQNGTKGKTAAGLVTRSHYYGAKRAARFAARADISLIHIIRLGCLAWRGQRILLRKPASAAGVQILLLS